MRVQWWWAHKIASLLVWCSFKIQNTQVELLLFSFQRGLWLCTEKVNIIAAIWNMQYLTHFTQAPIEFWVFDEQLSVAGWCIIVKISLEKAHNCKLTNFSCRPSLNFIFLYLGKRYLLIITTTFPWIRLYLLETSILWWRFDWVALVAMMIQSLFI